MDAMKAAFEKALSAIKGSKGKMELEISAADHDDNGKPDEQDATSDMAPDLKGSDEAPEDGVALGKLDKAIKHVQDEDVVAPSPGGVDLESQQMVNKIKGEQAAADETTKQVLKGISDSGHIGRQGMSLHERAAAGAKAKLSSMNAKKK